MLSNNKINIKKNIIIFLIAILAGVVSLVLMLCLLSIVICSIDIPLYTLSPITTVCCTISAFIGGMVCSWMKGEKGLICGITTATGLYLLLIIISAVNNQLSMDAFSVTKLVSIFIAGAMGGFLGISFKEKMRNHH